jgi:hypothetical protein
MLARAHTHITHTHTHHTHHISPRSDLADFLQVGQYVLHDEFVSKSPVGFERCRRALLVEAFTCIHLHYTMYVCIYVCMYVCVCSIYVLMLLRSRFTCIDPYHRCVCVCMCSCTWVCVHVRVYVFMYVCTYACMIDGRMCVCMDGCMHA